MTAAGRSPTSSRCRAAEPRLGGLIDRLTAEGRLRGARRDGRAIGSAGLAGHPGPGVTNDSRTVRAGLLFVAVPGLTVDGHDFVAAAAAAGAVGRDRRRARCPSPLPQLVVDATPSGARRPPPHGGTAIRAGSWTVVGITGTDGKTTTALPRGRRARGGRACGPG